MKALQKKLYLILAQHPVEITKNPHSWLESKEEGWVGHEFIEKNPDCPYSVKTAGSHRGKYLKEDEFIEIGEKGLHGKKQYRLKRDLETWGKLTYVLRDEKKYFTSNYYLSIQEQTEHTEQITLLNAAERIYLTITNKIKTGTYKGNQEELKAVFSDLKYFEKDLTESEEFKKVIADDEKIQYHFERFKKEGLSWPEASLKARAFVTKTSKEYNEREKNNEDRNKKRKEFLKKKGLNKPQKSDKGNTQDNEASVVSGVSEYKHSHIFSSGLCGEADPLKENSKNYNKVEQ